MPGNCESLGDLLKRMPLSDTELQQAVCCFERLWRFVVDKSAVVKEALVKQCTEAELVALGLGAPLPMAPPSPCHAQCVQQRLRNVQGFISHFRYNYVAGYHFNVSKRRPFSQLMRTAKAVIHTKLPIKCIEAAFLGMYLTAGWKHLQRCTLSFKSVANSQTYRHIVLVVHHTESSRFGALGISRQGTLMFKELTFRRLSHLVYEFLSQYKNLGHEVRRVSLSLPVEHDIHHNGQVGWNCCVLDLPQLQSEALGNTLDEYVDSMAQLLQRFKNTGAVPRFRANQSLFKEQNQKQ